jgi:hypothetical protein
MKRFLSPKKVILLTFPVSIGFLTVGGANPTM